MRLSEKAMLFLVIFSVSYIGQSLAKQQGQRPSGPPAEAIAACEGKQEGDQAQFTGRRGETVTGTCQKGKDGRLCLKPDHPPEDREEGQGNTEQQGQGQRPSGPPPEAITACEGKQEGDQAQFTGKQGETVTGTCQSGKDGTLFLKPDHPPKQARQKN